MPKTIYTPRDELVCGKLDRAEEISTTLGNVELVDLLCSIRHDCVRMEQKLIARKEEVQHIARPVETKEGEAVETSNPVQAARWIGREVESDNPMDDEDRPSTYDEETDEITYMPVRGTLDAVWRDGGWIGEVCVAWPIRLAHPVETKDDDD